MKYIYISRFREQECVATNIMKSFHLLWEPHLCKNVLTTNSTAVDTISNQKETVQKVEMNSKKKRKLRMKK